MSTICTKDHYIYDGLLNIISIDYCYWVLMQNTHFVVITGRFNIQPYMVDYSEV